MSSKVFQQHSSTLGAVCILLGQLHILIGVFCVYSWCSRKNSCTTKNSDTQVVIRETFKVAECRVFLLCTLHAWSSRIKRYITVVLWRNSCSLHQTVIPASNRLDRKTGCSRCFYKIRSSFYSWKVLYLVFPVLLSLSKYNPFASFGGIFPLKCFHAFSSDFWKTCFSDYPPATSSLTKKHCSIFPCPQGLLCLETFIMNVTR